MDAVMKSLAETAWQVAALVVFVLVIGRLLRAWISPRWRMGLWWLVVLRLAVPVLPATPLGLQAPSPRPERAAVAMVGADPAPFAVSFDGRLLTGNAAPAGEAGAPHRVAGPDAWTVAGYLWLAGLLLLVALTLIREVRLRRRLAQGAPVLDRDVLELFAECRRAAGVSREVGLRLSDLPGVPATAGILRPRIYLSERSLAALGRFELRLVLLHELMHVRHRDAAQNWLLHIVTCVHWFHPLVWLGLARLRAEREVARDLQAVGRAPRATGREYARTLLTLATDTRSPRSAPVAANGFGTKNLEGRIVMLKRFAHRPGRGVVLGGLLAVALVLIALTGSPAPASENGPVVPAAPPVAGPPSDGPAAGPAAVPLERIPVEVHEQVSEEDRAFRARLASQKVTFDFAEASLADALEFLRESTETNILIAEDAREDVVHTELTLRVSDLRLDHALDLLVRLAGFDWGVVNGAALIVSEGMPVGAFQKRVYNVAPLLDRVIMGPEEEGDRVGLMEELAESLYQFAEPRSWEVDGTEIQIWKQFLVIHQTPAAHETCERLLNGLLNDGRGMVAPPSPAAMAIEAALDERTSVHFEETLLREVTAFLSQTTGVPILMEPEVLEEEFFVSLRMQDVTVRNLLRILARNSDTMIYVRNGAVMLGREPELSIHIQSVRDLVDPEADGEAEGLMEVLMTSVDPESWDFLEHASVYYWRGLLIVAQTEENHAKIEGLLDTIRRAGK